ncbi:MAG: hypothetical protein ABL995_17195 [Bryobacteraceae bacterium]
MNATDRFDIAVGLVLSKDAEPPRRLIENISTGLSTYFSSFRWTLIHTHTGLSRRQRPPELLGLDNQIPVSVPWAGIQHVTFPWHGLPAKTAGYQAILTQAERVGAAASLIVDPTEEGFEPDWVDSLLRPGLHSRYDLVTPVHPEQPDQRMISANLISPLLAGLFGAAPREPMSGTFLVSEKLRRRLLSRRDWESASARYVPELWINFSAAAEGYRRAEAFVGQSRSSASAAILPPHVALIQIIESVFTLMEQYEGRWRSGKSADPLDQFGREQRMLPAFAGSADGLEYLVKFVNAYVALAEQWRSILDPHTFHAIDTFHSSLRAGDTEAMLADKTWVRVVYELAGSWKCRVRPRHQLAGLFVPLYWARIGSLLLKNRWTDQAGPTSQLRSLGNYFQGMRPALDRLWAGQKEAA